MSRSAGVVRRSGDPRKRAGQASQPATGTRKRVVIAGLTAGAALAAITLFALRPAGDDEADQKAVGHAEAACYLTSRADEATRVDTGARYAAAVLLLDKAIIESERAADAAHQFAALDEAVQSLHTAAHRGRPQQWSDALAAALSTCDESLR